MATPNIQLNDQQQNALDSLVTFMEEPYSVDRWAIRVSGYAGTGKTTTIQQLLKKVDARIVFSAPTHKAVKVMAEMARKQSMSVGCATIHSLLGLKVKEDGEKETLEPARRNGKSNNQLSGVDAIVVDECSMISKDLFQYINDASRTYWIKFIFLGDPAQLPPIGEDRSPTFLINGVTLTKVMRQRGENPILGLCTDLREYWSQDNLKLPPVSPVCSDDGEIGLHVMSGGYFREYMPHAFSHENFDDNHDRFRIIAWTNPCVDEYNHYIQQLRYPGLSDPFAPGEPVAFSTAMKERAVAGAEEMNWWDNDLDEIKVNTETEGTVISATCIEAGHPRYPELKDTWQVEIQMENGVTIKVWYLGHIGKILFEGMLNRMAAKCRAKDMNWKEFWNAKSSFANIRPAYAMTAHKSQGSTFENVFVDLLNIWRNPNKSEALQCLYVACSRASHHLILNGCGSQP